MIELLIVCGLIAVFLGLSLPTLRNTLTDDELGSATRKIIGYVKELRILAVREHTPYLLHFELDEGRLWYEADSSQEYSSLEEDAELAAKNSIELPESITIDEVIFSSKESESLNSATLWINKQGYMDHTVVHLGDDKNGKVSIVFSPFSGSARVYDDYVEAK